MAVTSNSYTGNGSTTLYSFTFPYISTSDIKVTLDGTLTTQYSYANATQIQFTSAPGNNVAIKIFRETESDENIATFYPGSAIRAADLNNNSLQNLYVSQEVINETDAATAAANTATTTATNATNTANTATTTANNATTTANSAVTTANAATATANTASTNATNAVNTANSAASSAASAVSTANAASTTANNTASQFASLQASAWESGAETVDSTETFHTSDDTKIATSKAIENRIDAKITGYYTKNELNAGQLDNRYYTESESDARYFNVSTGDTIKDGDAFPDNDTTIATTAAINDRIIDLVDDVGGFVPIANETSFPNTNPDVNNSTGTIVSIGSLAGNLTSNGSGVISINNGTVGNSTVTINGAANNTTYSAGYGMLVETTSTLNTYTFHRLSSKATEVSTVAGNIANINTVGNNNANINTVAGANSNITTVSGAIANVNTVGNSIANVNTVATNLSTVNDFADKYRIASSAPSSNNDDGDLYYNTSDNKLYVYNGSAWEVAASLNGSGGTVTGDTKFTDNTKLRFGDSGDLLIYHNGTTGHTQIEEGGSGNLNISGANVIIQDESGTNLIHANNNGSVDLYNNGNLRLATSSTGATITGTLVADGLTVDTNTLHVDATNNRVGIGTTSPVTKLHIEDDSSDGGFYFRRTNGTIMTQIFGDGTSTNARQLMYSGGAGKISLNTAGVSYFNGGNVGIGTTSPGQALDVAGSLQLGNGNAVGFGDQSARIIGESGGSGLLKFEVNSAERMRIDSSGRVGIGTTSPASLLNIKGNDTAYGGSVAVGAIFQGEDSAGRKVQLVAPGSVGEAGVGTPTNHMFTLFTGNTERMRIDTSGNVGIGTSSPNSYSNYTTLTLDGSSSGQIDIESGGTKYGDLYTATNFFHIRNKQASGNGSLAFHTTGSGTCAERMRIDSSGNVGIGLTDPSQAKLVAQTSSGSSIAAIKDNTGAAMLFGGVTQPRVLMEAGASGEGLSFFTAGGSSYSSAGWSEKFQIKSNGDADIKDGDLVIGTAGHGINFSATSGTGTSEILDDYEEGTWTPTDGSGASLSFSNTSGNCHYTKTGRTVVASFRFTYPSTSNNTVTNISGLPFTCIGTTVHVSGAFITETSDSSSTTIIVANGTNNMLILHCNNGVAHRTNSSSSGKDYRGVAIYQTA